ncbi:MAG TPA: glycosyl hydrolase 108 family protein [Bacteroidia bacterium]|jgi:lysozyme family protein|nr:glycosyl hydrolase 108 family protein [Bacteroidia bacterium]
MDINKAFDILMEFEGGASVVSVPQDKGGLTKYGINQTTYPNLNIKDLTQTTACDIYASDYWNASSCGKLKPELQYVHFDTAVNMGVVSAIKILQEAAGVEVDGVFGPETLTKSSAVSITEYLLLRQWKDDDIVIHRQDQIVFMGGWKNRNYAIYKMSKAGKLS